MTNTMSWGAVTIKYLLFIFNLLFVISGIIILAVGISIKSYFHPYDYFLGDKYFSAPNFLIAIGLIIFIIAFFGCCGAVKQNYCMIITFSSLLILIFVFEFAAGISGYVLRGETQEYLNQTLFNDIKKYAPNDTSSEVTKIWDIIQVEFNCCGVNNASDWEQNKNITKGLLPLSCCKIPYGRVGDFNCSSGITTGELHNKGCVEAFGNYVRDHAVSIGGVGLGFAALQILGILFSCHLAKKVKQNYEYM